MSLSFRVALACAGCTGIALTFAVALPWLIDEAPLFGPYRFTSLLTLSVVAPIYAYSLIRVAKWAVRQAARGADREIAPQAPVAPPVPPAPSTPPATVADLDAAA